MKVKCLKCDLKFVAKRIKKRSETRTYHPTACGIPGYQECEDQSVTISRREEILEARCPRCKKRRQVVNA